MPGLMMSRIIAARGARYKDPLQDNFPLTLTLSLQGIGLLGRLLCIFSGCYDDAL